LHQATRTVPIVFMLIPDPVGAGFVENLARPGGNLTGFAVFEYAAVDDASLKKISGASRRGSLTFFKNFAVLSSSAKT
jgi:hypothetical protein